MDIFVCAILCHCEQSEAINKQRIPMILASYTVDCHEAKASHNDNSQIL